MIAQIIFNDILSSMSRNVRQTVTRDRIPFWNWGLTFIWISKLSLDIGEIWIVGVFCVYCIPKERDSIKFRFHSSIGCSMNWNFDFFGYRPQITSKFHFEKFNKTSLEYWGISQISIHRYHSLARRALQCGSLTVLIIIICRSLPHPTQYLFPAPVS